MSQILVLPVSKSLRETYEKAVGLPYDQLIDATVKGYIRLWEAQYAGKDNIDEIRAKEKVDQPHVIRQYIESFVDTSVSREAYADMGDTLQAGPNRAMYIAIQDGEIQGVLQISAFAHEKFGQERPDATADLHAAVCQEIRCDPEFTQMDQAFAYVSKPQRNYAANNKIAALLLQTALTSAPHAQSAGLFSLEYDVPKSLSAAQAQGFKSVTTSTTMDSETPCHYMFGPTKDVLAVLKKETQGLDYHAPVLSGAGA